MADLPIMPLMTDALESDTASLSFERYGQYMRLLVRWWRDGCKPSSMSYLSEISGVPEGDLQKLTRFLTETPNGWVQKKLFQTFSRQMKKSDEAKTSINIRWHNEGKHKHTTVEGCPLCGVVDTDVSTSEDTLTLSPEILSMNHDPSSLSNDKQKSAHEEPKADFEEFWSVYPRRLQDSGGLTRGAKARAKRQWDRLKPDERKAALDGLDSYKRLNPDKSKGVVDAERYLRDARWNDAADAQDGNVPRETFGPLPEPEDETLTERWRALVYAVGTAKARSWLVTAGKPALETNCSGYILRCGGELQKQKIENDMRGTINAVLGKGEWRTEMVENP